MRVLIVSYLLLALAALFASSSTADALQSSSSSSFSAADACGLVPSLECLKVRRCSNIIAPMATIEGYWRTTVAHGVFERPQQWTNATICYNDLGLVVHEHGVDKYPFTPFTACNSYVWQKGSAMEMMIFPVKTPFDVPEYYYEIDMSPSGATYGTLIFNNKGNVTNCKDCVAGELNCTGANTFTTIPDLKLSAEYTHDAAAKKNGWTTSRFLPFTMFHELGATTRLFKFNLYRYDYPNGEEGTYELSGYSPTWNPSFHIPARFALMVLE